MNPEIQALDAKIGLLDAKLDRSVARIDARLDALDVRFDALSEKVDWIVVELRRLSDEIERVLNLLGHQAGEHHREQQRLEERMRTSFEARYATLDNRVVLHAGLVQSGARAISRFAQWSEGTDVSVSDALRRLEQVESDMARRLPPPPAPLPN